MEIGPKGSADIDRKSLCCKRIKLRLWIFHSDFHYDFLITPLSLYCNGAAHGYRRIHVQPDDKSLTSAMCSDLASRGEHFQPNERKVGDILTSLGLTNRIRVNPGHYVLCLNRDEREQIHYKVMNYEADMDLYLSSCDICMKIKNSIEATVRSQTADQNQKSE